MGDILCVKLRALGDTVIWTSALRAVKSHFPEKKIHVLTWDSNAPVLENLDFISNMHLVKTNSHLGLILKLLSFRKQNLDWLLGFHATESLCRWAWLAGAKQMALHHHSWTYTPKGSVPISDPGKLEDAISRDYQILKAVGYKGIRFPTKIETSGKSPHTGKKIVFLPGAASHLRRYPEDLWKNLVKRSLELGEVFVACDKSLSESWNLQPFCKELGISLFDSLSLREFFEKVKAADLAIANDSGPSHIAVALGLKTITLFGPGCVGDWHPYDEKSHKVFWIPVNCRHAGPREKPKFQYCGVTECSHHKCMRTLDHDEIFDTIRSL